MIVKKHTSEQWERINAFLKKAKEEDKLPESYYAHIGCEIDLTAWEAFANLKAQVMSINPFVTLKYIFTRETPEVEPSKDMRQSISHALIEVAKLGQVERAQGFIQELKADVNYMDSDGRTPLYHAIRRKRLGMAEMLLLNGADMYRRDGDSLDPLGLACAMGFHQAIPLFVKYGGDVNHPTPFKSWRKFYLGYQTFNAYPLAIAVSQNQEKVCQTLLDHGAKLDLEIRKGLTIQDFVDANRDNISFPVQTVFYPTAQKPHKVTSQAFQTPVSDFEKVRS